MIQFEIAGMRLKNPLNNREHWRVVSRRGVQQKASTQMEFAKINAKRIKSNLIAALETPAKVNLTRIGKRKMDSDGVAASFKHVRDAIAEWLGVDDGDESKVKWEYAQEIGKEYGVRVCIK